MKNKSSSIINIYLLSKIIFAVSYLLFAYIMYKFGIGCIFKSVLGLPCPGCGMSRAIISLLNMDIKQALLYHPMVFTMPILGIYYITDGKLFGKILDKIVLIFIFGGFIVNWIFMLLFNIR